MKSQIDFPGIEMTSDNPTRVPLPPPFPVGTRLRCIEGHDAYVASVDRPRDIKAHPEDWARISGLGIEVMIARVELGRQGTGRQLHDEDGPMSHYDGEPMLDETQDGYSVYQVVRGTGSAARMSGRCIFPDSAHRWQVLSAVGEASETGTSVRIGSFIKEGIDYGIVIASGAKTYDVVWIGGSTTRYRHGERDVRVVSAAEVDAHTRDHLIGEAEAARRERRSGAGIRRGTVSPRR